MIRSLMAVALLIVAIPGMGQTAGDTRMENELMIREFISAWSSLDAQLLASYFAEDGTYHNIPSQAVSGRDNIEAMITNFTRPWQETEWEILNVVSQGNTVVVERIDHTVVGGQLIDLPCLGIFEIEDGKIKVWRDYFDLATYTTALSRALNPAAP
ncbi:MAG: limonene,2-epoxide hydrolase [Pseudomonadota bacterium]